MEKGWSIGQVGNNLTEIGKITKFWSCGEYLFSGNDNVLARWGKFWWKIGKLQSFGFFCVMLFIWYIKIHFLPLKLCSICTLLHICPVHSSILQLISRNWVTHFFPIFVAVFYRFSIQKGWTIEMFISFPSGIEYKILSG